MRFDRRQIFHKLVTDVRVSEGRSRGGVALRLADLGSLPDEQLAFFCPALVPGCALVEDAGVLWAAVAEQGGRVRLFTPTRESRLAIDSFNGATPLRDVAHNLARHTGWDLDHSSAYVRGLFLHLVTLGVCLPG